MTTKPDLLKWVTDDDSAKISDPGAVKKLAGFLYKEKVAFQYLNWMWNKASKWFLGLQGGYYDIVIGSAAQVAANEATHDITDLDDTLAVAGSRILFLDGTHTLTSNLVLSKSVLKIISESPRAILDVSTYTATFSGLKNIIKIRVINAGVNDIIISGVGTFFEGIDVPLSSVNVSVGAVAITSGAFNGIEAIQFKGLADSATSASTANVALLANKVGVLTPKVIDIGDWNMDTSGGQSVAHGLTYADIMGASATIRDDADGNRYDLGYFSDVSAPGTLQKGVKITPTNINLSRATGGFFDGTGFDSTSYNRGWITIWYLG